MIFCGFLRQLAVRELIVLVPLMAVAKFGR